MSKALLLYQAKAKLSELYDEVENVGPRVVARRKSEPVVLTRQDDLKELLDTHFPFSTQMSRSDDGTVSIWLDQFDVYGRGASIAEAVQDLIDEVEAYVDEWNEGLRRVPNHAGRKWWVYRAQLAAGRDELSEILFPSRVPAHVERA